MKHAPLKFASRKILTFGNFLHAGAKSSDCARSPLRKRESPRPSRPSNKLDERPQG